jgi:5-methylcytosine-specific restriction endonuclease McrA
MPYKNPEDQRKWVRENRDKTKAANKRWIEKDPEHARELGLERAHRAYKKDPEKYKKRSADFRKENPEKVKKTLNNWEKEHREERLRYKAEYRRTHKKIITDYRKNNPDKFKVFKQNRRAREVQADGSFTAKQWRNLCDKYSNRCLDCGRKRKLTADHVVPLSKGGTNRISNIQPLCGSCNSKKGTKTTDFRKAHNVKSNYK